IYNFPLVAQTLSVGLMQKLAEELPTLAGSKESHNDFDVWLTLNRTTNLAIMSANERVWWTACAKLGGRGMFSVLTSAVPGLLTQLQAACTAGDWTTAESLDAEFRALVDLAATRPYLKSLNRIAQAKALVNACGWLNVGTCRPPLISVPREAIARLRAELLPRFEKWLAPSSVTGG
ncbi:MAG TPA: dihydrodipicolinate synthase family protein, partial [Pirellulales bacterium]